MRRLGLRIALTSGGWSAVGSLVVAVAVAVGVTSMLVLLSVPAAVDHRADRSAWTQTPLPEAEPGAPGTVTVAERISHVGPGAASVVSVGPAAAGVPLPAGVPSLPAPGEAYLSPALVELVARTPGALGRFGDVAGEIGPEGLRGPDDLVALVGVEQHQVAPGGAAVTAFPDDGQAYQASGIERLTVLLGSVALVVLVAVLVGAALRMTATRRRRRMAALGLLGATERQVARVAEGEMAAPAVLGALGGAVLFVVVRPLVASYEYEGTRFYPDDLWPGAATIAAVTVAVLVACVIATRTTMRRVTVDALSVVRQDATRRARVARWAVLVAALTAGGLLLALQGGSLAAPLVVAVFALLMVGIVTAGPEMTRLVGTALARVPRPAAVLAGNRLEVHPADGFRPAAGVALALLITTTFVALVPAAAQSLETVDRVGQREGAAQASIQHTSPADAEELVAEIAGIDGISDPVAVHTGMVSTADDGFVVWVANCSAVRTAARIHGLPCDGAAALARADARAALTGQDVLEVYDLAPTVVTNIMAVPDSAEITSATVSFDVVAPLSGTSTVDLPDILVDPATLDPGPSVFRPELVLFSYSDDAALERARTVIESSQPTAVVSTRATTFDGYSEDVRRLYDTITAGTTALVVIATLALALATTSTIIERRRFDTTLRTIGVPDMTVRRATLLETVIPLLVAALTSAALGIGFGAAVVTTTSDTPYPLAGVLPPVIGTVGAATVLVLAITLVVEGRARRATVRWE